MNSKRSFPDDWSNLTDEQVLENVKYLYENISKYKIKSPNSENFYATVRIGNVLIKPIDIDNYRINNKEINRQDNPILWKKIISLVSAGAARVYTCPELRLLKLWAVSASVAIVVELVAGVIIIRDIYLRYNKNESPKQELLQDKTGIQDKAKEYDATKLFNAKDSLQKVR